MRPSIQISACSLIAALVLLSAKSQAGSAPIKVIKKTIPIPQTLTLDRALESIEDIPALFDRYQPVVPWVPGVSMEIQKEVISRGRPAQVALKLDGTAPFVSNGIHEKALVSATVEDSPCSGNTLFSLGRKIRLDFHGSSKNVERRVDRIEIQVCATPGNNGASNLKATGSLYEGYLPIDPSKSGTAEKIAATAIQTAFLKQVEPMVDAVQDLWKELPR